MNRIILSLFCVGITTLSYSQVDPNQCSTQIIGGGYQSVTASWTSVTNQNSYISYLNTGVDCPVNVGIGTATPSYQLDVFGTTRTSTLFSSSKIALGIDPQLMTGHFHMRIPVASNYGLPYDVFRIEASDNKQIFNIDHTGLLRAREIIVDAQTWPDYVFRPGYYLMPLTEVEEFIEEKGHLPNVPSEEEVAENGQSLGEMNQVLLEKVEELTLYLIEQQKQIDELKAQLQKQ